MMFMAAVVLLLNLLLTCNCVAPDILSCTSHKYCHCTENVLLCNLIDKTLILPEHISLGEAIESMTIQGESYSVDIPDKYYNKSWSVLKRFEINDNRKRLSLPLKFTQALENLTNFRIRNSNLYAIESCALSYLRNIVEMDLSNNGDLHVTEVENGLKNFSSETIKVFNISGIHNAVDMEPFAITRGLLSPLLSVEVLDLSWTRASTLLSSFNLMPNLVSVNISGTILLGPAVCFSSLVSLRNLEIFIMDHWPKLARDDDLSYPRTNSSDDLYDEIDCKPTRFIDNNTGCVIMPPKLREVYSRFVDSQSMFVSLEKGVCILNNSLELLSFSHLKIFEPVNALYGFHKLKVFDLSLLGMFFKTNLLFDMPELETFLSPGNLLYNIETDPGFQTLFFRNKNLKYVDLSNNDLRNIPEDVFSRNLLLEIIDLSTNLLVCIKLNLSGNVHLRTLDLKQNRIKTISPELMTLLENMFANENITFQLNIEENNLMCECENIEFVKWVKTTNTELVNGDGLVCTDMDAAVAHIMEVDILRLESVCSSGSEIPLYVILILGIIFPILVLVFITVMCLRHHRVFCFDTKVKVLNSATPGTDTSESSSAVIELEEISFSEPHDGFILVPKGATHAYKRNPKYAVFLAYCHEDSDFVVKKIHKSLEENLRKYLPDKHEDMLTLLYDKNFLPGVDLYDICKAAVINSYVTIAIISERFISSNWCSYEMQTAIEAGVPIIPLYLSKCDSNKLSGIIKLIYDKKVRLMWPQADLDSELISSDEQNLIHCLAKTVAAYVRKYDS